MVMHEWPGVTPWNIETLPMHWWAYLVRAAKAKVDAHRDAADRAKGRTRGR